MIDCIHHPRRKTRSECAMAGRQRSQTVSTKSVSGRVSVRGEEGRGVEHIHSRHTHTWPLGYSFCPRNLSVNWPTLATWARLDRRFKCLQALRASAHRHRLCGRRVEEREEGMMARLVGMGQKIFLQKGHQLVLTTQQFFHEMESHLRTLRTCRFIGLRIPAATRFGSTRGTPHITQSTGWSCLLSQRLAEEDGPCTVILYFEVQVLAS
jgi:hypothetical protein